MYPFSKRFSLFVVLFSVALLQPKPMQAQQTLGGITGTVIDPSGSAIPDVDVKATSEDTGLERTAKSNAQGTYALNDLPIGKYTRRLHTGWFFDRALSGHPGAGRPHRLASGAA